jgi:hypothetical protein
LQLALAFALWDATFAQVIVGAVVSETVTAKVRGVPVLPHKLPGVTVTLPEAQPKFTVMDGDPWPVAITAPLGTDQV